MADENAILNNPYEEPQWHYATNLQGELDYARPVKGRRCTPETQSIPVADIDLLIAATAKAHNLAVATLNTNDFDAIQGITVEDRSRP